MLDFEKRLQGIGQQTILCVGDLMLDDFVYGEVGRISPEAPAPVLAVKRNEMAIGGAGNVARNVASLGARCIFVGLVGDDEAGREVIARLQADPLIEPSLVVDRTRPTTRKVRFVSEHFSTHLLRADWEQAGPVDAEREGELLARALAALPRVGAVVLSDYAKGALTPRLLARDHRGGEQGRHAGDRRSEGRRLFGLSRRDRAQAEPQGTGRDDAHAGFVRRRRRRGGGQAQCRSRHAGRPLFAQRRRADAGAGARRADPRAGLSGAR